MQSDPPLPPEAAPPDLAARLARIAAREAVIGIVGLGYVGLPLIGGNARWGHGFALSGHG